MCYLITPPDRGMIQRVQESRVAPVKVRGVKGEVGLKLFIEIILQTCKYSFNMYLDTLVELVSHGGSDPGEGTESPQGELLARAHSSPCSSHLKTSVIMWTWSDVKCRK